MNDIIVPQGDVAIYTTDSSALVVAGNIDVHLGTTPAAIEVGRDVGLFAVIEARATFQVNNATVRELDLILG